MDNHHLPLYTAGQMRRTDSNAIKKLGVPGAVLMERAGMAVAEYLLEHFCEHHCFKVLAGKGNNGGDGFVVARHLAEAGADVSVFAVADAGEYKGDALTNLRILGKMGLKVNHTPGDSVLRRALASDCIVVDAVFGTGFSGEPRGRSARFIQIAARAADRSGIPVVAVDIASGVDASTGVATARALPADTTVTFHVPKVGHFVAPGSYLSGDVILADIGIPAAASAAADHFLTAADQIAAMIPPKMDHDNKFSTGRVLVVGGSTGLTGAACLASLSALRSGAGVVTAAVPASLNPIFEQRLLEVMTLPLDDRGGHLSLSALDRALEAAASVDCLALGPGLGRDPGTASLVRKLLALTEVPVVLDADGLNALAGKPGSLRKRRGPTVLTPHAGELGRLMGVPAAEVAENGLLHARNAARRTGAVVLLKGSHSIATDGRTVLINPTGNPGLATAGSGDILTGVTAALLAKGLDPLNAAAGAALLHGSAADLAAGELGMDNIIASDLLNFLPPAFAGPEDSDA
ncbi:bifunctional NAD(P)H-hydrate repair enzyme Nnr [bacterium BMS3Abin01]|nr:bifunctional NAD(P)H-hydrate repair enzyme Nnr [bacterium BMS3Abin01]